MRQLIRLTVGYLILSLSLASFISQRAEAGSISNVATTSGVLLMSTAATSGWAGSKFSKICGSPTGVWACPLAVLSFAQMFQSSGDAREAFNTRGISECSGHAFCSGQIGPSDSSGGSTGDRFAGADGTTAAGGGAGVPRSVLSRIDKMEREAKQGLADMADKGYTYNNGSNSVSTPDGKQVNAGSFSTNSGAGALTLQQRKEMEAILNEAKTYAAKQLEFGGSGSGGSKSARGGAGESGGLDLNAYMQALQGGRKPASSDLSGLKKYIGNEPVGVSVDNIFDMVSRRYKVEAGTQGFIP